MMHGQKNIKVEYYVRSHKDHRWQIVWCCSEKVKFACRIT